MLVTLCERPEIPVVSYNRITGLVTIEVNPYYQFTRIEYEVEVRSILARFTGQEITTSFRDQLVAKIHDVLLRAWLLGDLLVDWPEPSTDPAQSPLVEQIEKNVPEDFIDFRRHFEQEHGRPLGEGEIKVLAEFWAFLKG